MGLSDRLPGMKPGSRMRNVVIGVGYLFVILMVIGALGGGGGSDGAAPSGGEASTATAPAAEADTETVAGGGDADTPTPVPTLTPTPEPTPAPDGPSFSFDGAGNDVTDSFETLGGLVVLAFEHQGSSNFQVQAVSSGGDERFLVNEIGDYDGEVALYLPPGEWRLDVTADGAWSAGVEQPRFSSAEVESPPIDGSGEHAAWFGPIEFQGGEEVTFEIVDDSQAGVWLTNHHGERVDLLHNEIGPYEGTALVTDSGVGLIVVDTDSAEWRLEIRRG